MNLETEHGCAYTTSLPEDAIRARNIMGVELLSLKKGKRKWTTANVEKRHGLPLLIYSPFSNRYWYRELGKKHDMNEYRQYIRDGNLYIAFNEQWKQVVKEEREQEQMGYYDYNEIRAYILLKEHLVKQKETDTIKTKIRAIDITINQIKTKYDDKEKTNLSPNS